MRNLIVRGLACLIVVGVWSGEIRGQSRGKSSQRQDAPFDITARTLPRDFVGNDPVAIIKGLQKRADVLSKDEYETTAEHKARIARVLDEPISGTVYPDSTIAFIVPVKTSSFIFDADRSEMTVAIPVVDKGECGSNVLGEYKTHPLDCAELVLDTVSVPKGPFKRQNSFGAVVDVLEVSNVYHGASFERYQSVLTNLKNGVYGLQIPMSSSAAKSLKEYLRVLVIGKLSNTKVSTYSGRRNATLESPVEISWKGYRLHLIIKDIWVYDTRTGQIHARLTS